MISPCSGVGIVVSRGTVSINNADILFVSLPV
jgi:hypothetical protein